MDPRPDPGGRARIRPCTESRATILSVINDAARAYRGVIPEDCWHDPYMSAEELDREIESGVAFRGYDEGEIIGVMGVQDLEAVSLIRHAYVRSAHRRKGIGGELLRHVQKTSRHPLLVGTWAAADWAIRFYEKHGFTLLSTEEKDELLRTYWSIPERQARNSVVLADPAWTSAKG